MTNQSPLGDDWDDLVQDWQTQPTKHTDADQLLKLTRKRNRRGKCVFVADIVATLFLIGFWCYSYFFDDMSVSLLTWLGFMAVGAVYYLHLQWQIRRSTWQMLTGAPDSMVDFGIRQLDVSLRFLALIRQAAVVLTIGTLVWVSMHYWFEDELLLWALLWCVSWSLLMYAVALKLTKKRQLERQALLSQQGVADPE